MVLSKLIDDINCISFDKKSTDDIIIWKMHIDWMGHDRCLFQIVLFSYDLWHEPFFFLVVIILVIIILLLELGLCGRVGWGNDKIQRGQGFESPPEQSFAKMQTLVLAEPRDYTAESVLAPTQGSLRKS